MVFIRCIYSYAWRTTAIYHYMYSVLVKSYYLRMLYGIHRIVFGTRHGWLPVMDSCVSDIEFNGPSTAGRGRTNRTL